MRRRLAIIVTSIAALTALPAAAHAAFFAGEALDGPSSDVRALGDVDLARDGTGALAYVRRDAGVDHIYVARLVGGAFQAPERVDTGIDTASSQPAVAAADGGRIAVAFISGGQALVVVRPGVDVPWTAPQQLSAGNSTSPSVDMSINGVAYATWTSGGDVRAARLDRGATTFGVLGAPLDVNPAADAGIGTNRSRVAIAADSTAVAVWGEAGHVYARRLYGMNISTAPLDLNVAQLDGHTGGTATAPDVDVEDDSSFAWISFRQNFDDGGAQRAHAIGVRLRGSRTEDPIGYDGLSWGGDSIVSTDVDINGRGEGTLTAGTTGGVALAGIIKDDKLNVAVPLGGSAAPAQPVSAIAETLDRTVGWLGVADGTVHAVFYADKPSVRAVPSPGADTLLSNPDFGAVDPSGGFDVAGDRTGDFAFAFIQGPPDQRRLVTAVYDRPPGAFGISSVSSRWRNVVRTPVAWGTALDLWGPIDYSVVVDGTVVTTTRENRAVLPPGSVPEGLHSWRVVATDRRGQVSQTPLRTLKVDTVGPKVTFSVKRRRRMVTVTARAADVLPPSGRAAGVASVRIDFGDRTPFAQAAQATHRYAHTGPFTVRVTATDRAGNVTVLERRIHIGGRGRRR